jgi:hypothetical protein
VAYDSNTTEELTDMAEVNVNLKKPLEGGVLQVSLSLKVTREFKLRLWLGKILLLAATRALGAGIEFTKPTPPPTDKELVDIDGLASNLAASKIRKALDTASDNPNKVVKCAGTLLIGEGDTIAELRKAPATVRLPCGCYDVCTDQRPGHPSSDQSLDSWRDDYSPTASQHWCGDPACAETPAIGSVVAADKPYVVGERVPEHSSDKDSNTLTRKDGSKMFITMASGLADAIRPEFQNRRYMVIDDMADDQYNPARTAELVAAGGYAELAAATSAPRSLYTDATHCKCGMLLWFTKERESGVCTGCADHEFIKHMLQQNGSN